MAINQNIALGILAIGTIASVVHHSGSVQKTCEQTARDIKVSHLAIGALKMGEEDRLDAIAHATQEFCSSTNTTEGKDYCQTSLGNRYGFRDKEPPGSLSYEVDKLKMNLKARRAEQQAQEARCKEFVKTCNDKTPSKAAGHYYCHNQR